MFKKNCLSKPMDNISIFSSVREQSIFKETKSATTNIFRKKKNSSKNGVCKSRIKLCFHDKSVHYSWKLHGKVNYPIKQVFFLLLVIICVPPIIIDSKFLI